MCTPPETIAALLADHPLPAAVVDLDAVEQNAKTLLAAAGDKPIRLASKSVRIPEVLRLVQALSPRFRGLMAFHPREASLLASFGHTDLLVAYPVARRDDAEVLADLLTQGIRVLQVVDDPAQIALLNAVGVARNVIFSLCIDVDVSLRVGPLHLGVRRSPIRSATDALTLAASVGSHTRIRGIMAYEAQVAGLADDVAGKPHEGPIRQWIKSRSRPLAALRRQQVVDALRQAGHDLQVVNGGGTGSLASTREDAHCTEVTAGSGLLAPHLFDGYRGLSFRPAGYFALPVVRRSDADHVTGYGGGYIASGSTGSDRSPRVVWPPNLVPLGLEGFGEVQTPLRITHGTAPTLGSAVLCRPAKAGEWLERFNEVVFVRGGQIAGVAPTYRGLGGAFG